MSATFAFSPRTSTHCPCCLSRVIYLLRGCPQEQAVSYLLNRALSEDASVSASHRLRALRCLLAIGDEAVIQKQYKQGVDSLRLVTVAFASDGLVPGFTKGLLTCECASQSHGSRKMGSISDNITYPMALQSFTEPDYWTM